MLERWIAATALIVALVGLRLLLRRIVRAGYRGTAPDEPCLTHSCQTPHGCERREL